MVRLCQAALRRPPTCAALSRPLHPPHGHLQPSPDFIGRREDLLPMARLCTRQPAAPHDPRCRPVPAPLLPAPAPPAIRAHPPLRTALQPLLRSGPDAICVRSTWINRTSASRVTITSDPGACSAISDASACIVL